MSKDETKLMKKINMKLPFCVVIHQTESRTTTEIFDGEDAEADAKARASEKAKRTGSLVAVLGPQIAVFGPPPKAEAVEIQLGFQLDNEAE